MNQNNAIGCIAVIAVSFLLHSMNPLHADQEPQRSLAEMLNRSEFVADGQVSAIELVATEETPYPNQAPVVRSKYRASFLVSRIVKGKFVDKKPMSLVYLEYWHTDDKRFRGTISPKLSVGDQFRLFGETMTVGQDGVTTVNLHTANSLRPEALGDKNESSAPSSKIEVPPNNRESTPAPKPSPVVQPPTPKAPEAKPTVPTEKPQSAVPVSPSPSPTAAESKSTTWSWIIGTILLLVVAGGILFKLRRK